MIPRHAAAVHAAAAIRYFTLRFSPPYPVVDVTQSRRRQHVAVTCVTPLPRFAICLIRHAAVTYADAERYYCHID